MANPLVERLAAINDPHCWDKRADKMAVEDPLFARARASSLAKAARCLAEIVCELGAAAAGGFHLHVHLSGDGELTRLDNKLHLRFGQAGKDGTS